MKALIAIAAWLPVIVIKVVLILVGLVLVMPYLFLAKKLPGDSGLYRVEPKRPRTYWEAFVRNPVAGFRLKLGRPHQWGLVLEPHNTRERWQWRFMRAGIFASFRCVWRYNATRYGELYLGWKLGRPESRFALSLRPWATVGN